MERERVERGRDGGREYPDILAKILKTSFYCGGRGICIIYNNSIFAVLRTCICEIYGLY